MSYGLPARLVAGAVLIYAGTSKAAGPTEEFALVLANYQFLPLDMVMSAAAFVPWIEVLVGWALVLGWRTREAAAGAAALFSAFCLAILSTLARGIQLPNCGCFGEAIKLSPPQTLLLDLALLGLCVVVLKNGPGPASLDAWAERGYTGRRG